jgi:hypothetical protein
MKVEAESETARTLQTVGSGLAREIEYSSLQSFSVTPTGDALSFLKLENEATPLGPDLTPIWGGYLAYFYRPEERQIYRRFIELDATASQRVTPEPIESLSMGELTNFLEDGRPLGAAVVTEFQAAFDGSGLKLTMTAAKKRYGNTEEDTFSMTFFMIPRNS